MNDVVRWQLDMPVQRAKELDALEKQYNFSSRKDLINTALSLLQWAIDEVKSGHTLASVDDKNQRYKELVLPVFKMVAAEASRARTPLRASIAELDEAEVRLVNSPADNSEAIQKVQKAKELVKAAAELSVAA